MTKIKPLTGGINLEVRHIGGDGHALINVGPLPKPSVGGYVSEQSARYPVADLLAALDATANADAEAKLLEQYRRADKAEAEAARLKDAFDDRVKSLQAAWDELGDLRAEHDALAATVERVRLALFELDTPGNQRLAEKHPFEFGLLEACKAVRAALDPKPAFVLPTEVPARIIAEESDGTEHEFTLWSDGKGGTSWWHDCEDADEEGALYSDVRLMRDFTDHRLLDGAE